MGHRARLIGLATLGLALVACPAKSTNRTAGARLRFPRGGVVRVAVEGDVFGTSGPGDVFMDPQREYAAEAFEILRCCLQRSLFNYSGKPTNEGGAQLRLDLAAALPVVSVDGLRWTFRIKKGIHYSPPLASQEVVAGDFVTALKREARVTAEDFGQDYRVYYEVIQGFKAYEDGKADSISGLSTPDAHTLIVTLNGRVGDLASRFALAASAPIPTLKTQTNAPFGIATGHDAGFGRFQPSTGPYMWEGIGRVDFTAAAAEQKPASGVAPGGSSLTLVRNPSWRAATDDLRPAYPNRIEVDLAKDIDDIVKRIDDGRDDTMMWGGPPAVFPADVLRRYRDHPDVGRLIITSRDSVRYATMNIAAPPFDDVHVRKAANYIVDKAAFIERYGRPLLGQPVSHILLDSLEDNQLVNYDPYRTSGPADALAKAEAEMRLSRYDTNKDGLCDVPACRGIDARTFGPPPQLRAATFLIHELGKIGLRFKVTPMDGEPFFTAIGDPRTHVAIGAPPAWIKDFINASNYIVPLFASDRVSPLFSTTAGGPGTVNFSLVGASSAQLARWGYRVRSVPSVDDRINQCLALTGVPQQQCWIAMDQYMMEKIVPWIPLFSENTYVLARPQVINLPIDQFVTQPSLDQIVIRGSASPSPSPSS